jgi:hypothetical protein
LSDVLLERIATEATLSPSEVRFTVQWLTAQLGAQEMMNKVVNAVSDGQETGHPEALRETRGDRR